MTDADGLPVGGLAPDLVLVVEDDEGLRRLLARTLTAAGFRVLEAAAGIDAISLAPANPGCVLLLDHRLPDLDGLEVISRLHDQAVAPAFVMMTGQGDERLAVECMQRGAADYLVKDADLLDRLPGVLARVFRNQEVQRRLDEAQRALQASEEQLSEVNTVLLDLGADHAANLQRLTGLAGKMLHAACALYNRLDRGLLVAQGQWQTPLDFQAADRPDGHICSDVIRQGSDAAVLLRNLLDSPYARTDPNVVKYGLRTYLGHCVRCAGEPVGSLCVVYDVDRDPPAGERRLLGIIAAAIGREEERQRAVATLCASEQRFRDVAEASAGIIWEVDERFTVTYISGRVREIFGCEPAEIVGQHPSFLIDPDDRDRVAAFIARTVEERLPVKDFESWCRASDGRRIRLRTNGVPIIDPDGRLRGYRGTHLDVSEVYWSGRRREALLRLHQMSGETDAAISSVLCAECAGHTDSPLGFFGLIESDGAAMVAHVWSPSAMVACQVPDKPLRFPIPGAGLWAEPIRRRQPVIVNDYLNCEWRRGLPGGHVPLTRFLGVPVVLGDQVIAVTGVANKTAPYDDDDVLRLRMLATTISDFLFTRRAEQEVRVIDRRLRTFIDFTANWEYWRLPDGKHLYNSPSCERITGYPAAAFDADPELVARIVHPDDRARFDAHVEAAASAGAEREIEFRIIRRDGGIRWIQHVCRPIRYEHGADAGTRVSNRDITDRKLAEQELLKAKLIVENIQIGLYLYHLEDRADDRTLRMIYANPATEALTGVRADQIIGRTLDECFPGLRALAVPQRYAEVVRTGVPITLEDVHYGDRRVPRAIFAVRAFPLPGDHVGIAFENVTEQRRAQAALRESEERYRLIADHTSDSIWAMDPDLRFTYLSPSTENLFGYSPREWKTLPWDRFIHPDDLPAVVAAFEALRWGGADRAPVAVRVFHKDGRMLWVEFSAAAMQAADGTVAGFAGVTRDITARKQAEEELRRSNERLHALASRLEKVREDERARVSRQIHDELGQLLTGLKIETNRLAGWLRRPAPPRGTRCAGAGAGIGSPGGDGDASAAGCEAAPRPGPVRIREKIGEIVALADEAIDTARRISREQRPGLIDDLGLVAAVESLLAGFRERSGIACEARIRLADAELPVEVALGIYRILQEALTNILRHARAERVRVRLFRRGGRVICEVADDGVGIGRVQLDSSQSIGLIGMTERALQIGGTLTVKGRPRRGTIVRLEIPLASLTSNRGGSKD